MGESEKYFLRRIRLLSKSIVKEEKKTMAASEIKAYMSIGKFLGGFLR